MHHKVLGLGGGMGKVFNECLKEVVGFGHRVYFMAGHPET